MNRFYPLGAQKILGDSIDLLNDSVKAVLVSSGYVYSAAHEFLSDVSATVIGSAVELTGKSITGGVFDADDVPFGAVAPGSTAQGVVLYVDTGNPSTSSLVCLIDELTGFPFATNGSNVDITWSNGSGKILSLV